MVFYYAVGGGLGHLMRAKKVLRALGIESFLVITAHDDIPTALFNPKQLLKLPSEWAKTPKKVFEWLSHHLAKRNAKTLIIDTFPMGICGEVANGFGALNIESIYVARYLKWDEYVDSIQPCVHRVS